ncbi:hypothetical protein AB0M95_01910 [Sphaerisporangium sp. NPDC051017]|uniref:hypothetical protein n=1 Tax=Sphaerisporangium sp. NPDC051017 TaxID=3154636 RepID=UPI003438FCCD
MSDLNAVRQAKRKYDASQQKTDEARDKMFDVWAAAAMSGLTPEEIGEAAGVSAAYVRGKVRARGVEPAARGPKRKK